MAANFDFFFFKCKFVWVVSARHTKNHTALQSCVYVIKITQPRVVVFSAFPLVPRLFLFLLWSPPPLSLRPPWVQRFTFLFVKLSTHPLAVLTCDLAPAERRDGAWERGNCMRSCTFSKWNIFLPLPPSDTHHTRSPRLLTLKDALIVVRGFFCVVTITFVLFSL